MTARNDVDRLLSAWLTDSAPTREPEHLLGEVLARTARTRRRPAWRIPERWFSMSAITSRLAPAPQVPWRLLALAVMVAALLVAGLLIYAGSPRPAPPFGLAANGSYFFSEGGDIYSQASADGPRSLIVGGETIDNSPLVAPDGTRLAFLRETGGDSYEVWIADADGENVRRMVGGTTPYWFEWLADGRTAIVNLEGQPTVMNIVGVNGTTKSFDLGVAIENAFPRPGHPEQIAFRGARPGGDWGIYLVNTDGTGLVRLDLDAGFQSDPAYSLDKDYYFWEIAWSPVGDRLLYTTLEPAPESPEGAGFRIHLATVDAAGAVSDERIIEFDPQTDDEYVPTWLPSGDGLVFESIETGQHWLSVVSVSADGQTGAPRRLNIQRSDWIGAQVSPDGRYVLGRIPAIAQVNLMTGSYERLEIGDDVSWQRLAP